MATVDVTVVLCPSVKGNVGDGAEKETRDERILLVPSDTPTRLAELKLNAVTLFPLTMLSVKTMLPLTLAPGVPGVGFVFVAVSAKALLIVIKSKANIIPIKLIFLCIFNPLRLQLLSKNHIYKSFVLLLTLKWQH